jgi:hypothetical protein
LGKHVDVCELSDVIELKVELENDSEVDSTPVSLVSALADADPTSLAESEEIASTSLAVPVAVLACV